MSPPYPRVQGTMRIWAEPFTPLRVPKLFNLRTDPYEPTHESPAPLDLAAPMAAALRLTFPTVVTPYGIAALIILLANAHDAARLREILAIVVGVLALDLLAMLFARRIMKSGVTVMALQVLGAVLGVLQVALAVEMIVRALRELGVLSG